eukprot:scaffold3854_cov251-Pinguiococcus_pyrenoidosus.AAC.8
MTGGCASRSRRLASDVRCGAGVGSRKHMPSSPRFLHGMERKLKCPSFCNATPGLKKAPVD